MTSKSETMASEPAGAWRARLSVYMEPIRRRRHASTVSRSSAPDCKDRFLEIPDSLSNNRQLALVGRDTSGAGPVA